MANSGISSIAVLADKQWDAGDRPIDWQGAVYGLVVHTTGGGLPAKARSHGRHHTVEAVEHYHASHGCHYVNGWRGAAGGDLIQVANEREQAAGVGVTNAKEPHKDQRRSIELGRFEADLPPVLVRLWRDRWPGKADSLELLPGTQSANSPYVHLECVPCVYNFEGALVTDEAAIPLRPNIRFTQAQLDTVALLAVDIATRNGFVDDANWWRTPRLLGHEDLTPISRHNSGGGWDPGWLRDDPWFDWDYVYGQIVAILNGEPGAPPLPSPDAGPSILSSLGEFAEQFMNLLTSGSEVLAVGIAHSAGVSDPNQLTNLVFFGRHPELNGRKLEPGETELVNEWLDIRDHIVEPALADLPPADD